MSGPYRSDDECPPMGGSFAAQQYQRLVDALGKELDYRRGWKAQTARRLGVHPSYVSKVVAGEIGDVSAEVIKRACAALGIDGQYFFDQRASDRTMPLMTHDEIVAELEALRPELRRHAVDTARLSRTCDVPVPRWKA